MPLAVQFTDRSTGTIEARLRSFGDGVTSTDVSPSHTYLLAGLYTPTLTVWGGGISDTVTRPGYIRAGAVRPEITFSGYTADSTDVAYNGQNELLGVAAVVGYGVYRQRIDAATGGRVGTPFAISSGAGRVDVRLAYHSGASRYLVIWRNTGDNGLYGQRVSASGSLIGGNFLIQPGVRRPEVAAFPITPTFLVVWTESPTATLRARFVSTEGSLLGEPILLAEGVQPEQAPALAVDSAGAALVVWAGGDTRIWARAVFSDGTSGSAFPLSGEGAAEPAVTDEAGRNRFFVVWRQGSDTVMGRPADTAGALDEPLILGQMEPVSRTLAAYDAATAQIWAIWGSNRYEDWEIYGRGVTAQGVAEGAVLPLIAGPGDEQGWNIAEAGTYGVYLTWQNGNTIYAAGFRLLRAEFEADIREDTVPLTVTFSNRSAPLGLIEQHLWDFGDGQSSAEIAPTHVYTRPGRYTVSLTVRGAG